MKALVICLAKYFLGLIAFILWMLPQWLKSLASHALVVIAFDVFRFRRQISRENLTKAFPELSSKEVNKLARLSYWNLAMGLFEYSNLVWMDTQWINQNFEITGMQNYALAQSKGKGVLLLTLHLGNGDLSLAALAKSGFPVHLISKHFNSQWLNELWFGLREKIGIHFIAEEKSSFQILRTLKKNGMVVFVLDQFMGPPIGVPVKFFGRPTGAASGLALFSLRTGAPVLPGYTYRRADGRMAIVFEKPIFTTEKLSLKTDSPTEKDLLDENLERRVLELTQEFTHHLEKIVRKHPDQWMWLHRRWKTFEVR